MHIYGNQSRDDEIVGGGGGSAHDPSDMKKIKKITVRVCDA